MILGLGIALVVLLLALWLFTMYASYKIEQGVSSKEITVSEINTVLEKITRIFRRGYYVVSMYVKNGFHWSNKKIETGFVKMVPSSAPLFEKKDELTGLKEGPMSFYLQSISESKEKPKKRLSRNKKMI